MTVTSNIKWIEYYFDKLLDNVSSSRMNNKISFLIEKVSREFRHRVTQW
jgi:hypothetical protein